MIDSLRGGKTKAWWCLQIASRLVFVGCLRVVALALGPRPRARVDALAPGVLLGHMGSEMNTGIGHGRAESAVATDNSRLGYCALPSCGKSLRWRQSRYCSDSHRFADWDRTHPRAPLLIIAETESYLAPRPLPETPEGRRDVGKAIAAANNRWQLGRAQELALEYLASHEVAIISDIRAFAAEKGVVLEWEKNWTANVFTTSSWFEATGVRRKTTHKRGNARKVNEYRLSPEGRRALEEMRR